MNQRDILKDQIEQLGKVLRKIVNGLLKAKSGEEVLQRIEIAEQQLKIEADIDIEKVKTFSKTELISYFKERKAIAAYLEVLAQYFTETGKMISDKARAKQHLKKAIELYEVADELSKAVSFERLNKVKEIKRLINRNYR